MVIFSVGRIILDNCLWCNYREMGYPAGGPSLFAASSIAYRNFAGIASNLASHANTLSELATQSEDAFS